MFITAVQIEGLADCPSLTLDGLDRTVRLLGPTPATTALGDGLLLAFAAISEPHCAALMRGV